MNASISIVEVLFDRDLVVGALDAGNWTLDVGPVMSATVVLSIQPRTVQLTHLAGQEATLVSYAPPPFDVVSSEGAPAEAFSDLSVTS